MEAFDEFLKERVYLKNVTAKTVTYYQCAFAAWRKHGNGCTKQFVINLREAGLSAVSINTYICAMNAYWRWAGEPKHLQYLHENKRSWPPSRRSMFDNSSRQSPVVGNTVAASAFIPLFVCCSTPD